MKFSFGFDALALLRHRRAFRSQLTRLSDTEYTLQLGVGDVPATLLTAMRRALAERCGIRPEYVHPDQPVESLLPLMSLSVRGCWAWDTHVGDFDEVDFVCRVEVLCAQAGLNLVLRDDAYESVPEFGEKFGPLARRILRRPPPARTVGEWMRQCGAALMARNAIGP
jgi:8-oxo-dGTP pyrophosphatase MutT (NUDIX family)